MLQEAGVELMMNVEVTSINHTEKGWEVASVTGKQIVDATGNATIAALAGAERVKSPDAVRQPDSYFFWLSSQGMEFDTDEVIRAYNQAIETGELLPNGVRLHPNHRDDAGRSGRFAGNNEKYDKTKRMIRPSIEQFLQHIERLQDREIG